MQIFFEFKSHEELIREFENNLSKARAYVLGQYDVAERDTVELVLIHPVSGEWMPLSAEVVYVAPDPTPAVGLEILEWGSDKASLVCSFVNVPEGNPLSLVSPDSLAAEHFELGEGTPTVAREMSGPPPTVEDAAGPPLELSMPPIAPLGESAPNTLVDSPRTTQGVAPPAGPPEGEQGALTTPSPAPKPGPESDSEPPTSSRAPGRSETSPPMRRSEPPPKNVQERVRKLNVRQRDHMARNGNLSERVALERAYGAAVWDALLSNPALTGPEVARIAKNGNATIPHLKLITGNPAWVGKPEVRRALLTNPRLTPPQIDRVLRTLPPAELKKLPKQTAYSPKVRAAATRMLPRS